ncbi:MAG: Gfo/Idh/MocA family oxidoreductase [Gemmataceae bacterium]
MLKLGVLDFDTSHVVEFTKRLNHVDSPEAQWVDGARVVIGCPGESKLSPERIPGYVAAMKKYGVPLVDDPAAMIGKVDAMLIEAVDGSVHWERARPFLEAGVPCFVDKPFTCSLDDAKRMVELAGRKNVPIFSSSALRYAPELTGFLADPKAGPVLGAISFGPGPEHSRNPGLFHYGIHAVEVLYTLMGSGCQRVTCTHDAGATVATGHWADGRIGTVRTDRQAPGRYGFTAFTAKTVRPAEVGTGVIYRELLKKVVETFATGKPAVDPKVTVEIVAFIEAANRSGANHGAVQTIKV